MAKALERVFTNSLGAGGNPSRHSSVSYIDIPDYAADDERYRSDIRAIIDDAQDFIEKDLGPDREENIRYYYGMEPSLSAPSENTVYDSTDDSPEDEDAPSRSTIVSTDVRDTIMAVMPSLMRIFAGSEHSVNFQANNPQSEDAAKMATDYIRYKFWEENSGFMVLYNAIMDCLQQKIGVITWWTEDKTDIRVETYKNVTNEQIGMILAENDTAEVLKMGRMDPATGLVKDVSVRFQKTMPQLRVEAVPLDEFRVSRDAKDINTAIIRGRDQYLRAPDLVALGYDPEVVWMFAGADRPYTADRALRNEFEQITNSPLNDLVRYGDYLVRIDRDGDGVAELRRICTMGDEFFIVDDNPVNNVNYAVFSPDPVQHTLIGNALADLNKDIQRINTNLVRGALDSLAQSINPRMGINELLANVDDALNEDLGALIRTRGNPAEALVPIVTPFVGRDAFDMKAQVDAIRQSRTGISEASKGIDPKALQSTTLMGVDLIATGAQERIELIARVIAECGIAPMYRGLLQEVINNQNGQEIVKLRGEWTSVDPSTFDANMRCLVNPTLGKGSDMTRLMALQDIKATQMTIIEKFGLNNGMVTVNHFRNTLVDMLAIANIKNVDRYFGEVTPELQEAIQNAPKEPDPGTLLAQAELEKVKKDIVVTQAKLEEQSRKTDMDDDFRRDQLNVQSTVDIMGIMAQFMSANIPDTADDVQALNSPGE